MPKITYRQPDGSTEDIDVPVGSSVMQGAVSNGVHGIVAECGGSAMCATCHVYVADGPLENLPPVNPVENEMLESAAAERKENSRLGCQIEVTAALDGLVVDVPERQN